jgi:ribonucleotide monophosphatase NagD (HAD superfamily)
MPMSYVCDMDGMIYHGSRLIPGALEFVRRLQSRGHKFLFLTNIAGTEAGMKTILVLSGVTTRELIETYPYRPTHIFEDVGHIPVAELG